VAQRYGQDAGEAREAHRGILREASRPAPLAQLTGRGDSGSAGAAANR